MLKFFTFCICVVSLYAFDYHLFPQKVADSTYCFFGKLENISKDNAGNIANSCYVQTKEGFVVIDSGPTFSYATQAYEEMKKIANLPIKYVIVTHDHDDHWQGNSFYKSKGALLIGPRTYEENVVAGMPTRIERIIGKELYGKTKIVKLDKVVDNNLTLKVSNKTFIVTQPEAVAHTKGDLIIFVKEQKVLFAGDLVFSGRLTSLRDGSLLGSIDALKKIDSYDAKVIIGGHGYEMDANVTQRFGTYLQEIKKEVLAAQDKDIGMESIAKVVTMPAYKKEKLYDVLHARTVVDAYKELEMIEDDEK